MAKLTLTINDDADQNNAGDAAVLNNTTKVFGTTSTNAEWVGFRVTSVTVPNRAKIRHAYLKVYCGSISASTSSYSLKGEDADNAAAFAAATNDLSGRTLTTAAFSHLMHDLADGYRIFDVTDIVQEIVDRTGWASGNAMVFMFNTPSLSTVFTISHIESANDPELGIIYDDNATPALPPTVSGTGAWTNPNNAFSSNDVDATIVNVTSGSQIWESFNIPSLTGFTIDGVLIKVEGACSSASSRAEFTVEVSWDGGTTWATAKRSFQLSGTSDRVDLYGGADAWSHTFISSELTNANFKVRVNVDGASSTNDYNIDQVTATVLCRPNGRPTVALNAPADASSASDTTPDLDSTATDPEAHDVRYNVQVDTSPQFKSQNSSSNPNLVANPSFETLTAGWADNWTRGGSGVYTVDTGGEGQAPNATNSLKITHTGEAQVYCKSAKITIDKTKSYYWSFTIKVTAYTSGSLDWNIEEFNSSHVSISNQYLGSKSAVGNWRITGTYTPTGGAGGNVAEIEFQFFHAVGTNTAYVDQVEIFEVNSVANVPKVSITMDDGWGSQYTNRASFNDRHIQPTLMITSDFVGTANYMTWSQIAELYNSHGWQIANHTKTHTDLTTLTEAQIVTEISTCQSAISSNVGITAQDHAYPYGSWNETARKVITRYCRGLRTYTTKGSEGAMTPPYEDTTLYGIKVENTNRFADVFDWIDEAITQGDWLILVFHELVTSSPTQFQYLVADLEKILDYMNFRRHRGDILPCTMEEGRLLQYKKVPLLDKISGTDAGFTNTVTGGDTDPFNSAEKVRHAIQSALSFTTYYWRVRANDPNNNNVYGNWSASRSFSIIAAIGAKIYQAAQAVKRASFF